jgi:hypothetical protein
MAQNPSGSRSEARTEEGPDGEGWIREDGSSESRTNQVIRR